MEVTVILLAVLELVELVVEEMVDLVLFQGLNLGQDVELLDNKTLVVAVEVETMEQVVQVVVEVLLVQEILDQVDQEILLTLLQIKEMMVELVQVNVE